MPESTSSRRYFRLFYWSLFALADIGLGVWLHEVNAYRPRCSLRLPSNFGIDWMSRDGKLVSMSEAPLNMFLGGGIQPGPFPGEGMQNRMGDALADTRECIFTPGPLLPRDRYWIFGMFSPSHKTLVALESRQDEVPPDAKDRAYLHIRDLRNGKTDELTLDEPFSSATLGFSPPETHALVGTPGSQQSWVIDIAARRVVREFSGMPIGFGRDGSLIVIAKSNEQGMDIGIHQIATGKTIHTISKVSDAILSAHGRTLAAVDGDELIVMELASLRTQRYKLGGRHAIQMKFSPDERLVTAFSPEGPVPSESLDIIDTDARKLRRVKVDLAEGFVLDASSSVFSRDSRMLAICSTKENHARRVTIYQTEKARLLGDINLAKGDDFRFAGDCNSLLVWRDASSRCDVMDVATRKVRHSILSPAASCQFTTDCQLVALQMAQPGEPDIIDRLLGQKPPDTDLVRVIDVAAGTEVARLTTQNLEDARVSDDGTTLITTHKEGDDHYLRAHDLPIPDPPRWILPLQLGLAAAAIGFALWRRRLAATTF